MLIDNRTRVIVPNTHYQKDSNCINYKTASLSINTEYSNFTGVMIYVKTQNNIPFAVDPNFRTASTDEPRANFEIKITYRLHNNDGIVNTFELLQGLIQHNSIQGTDAEEILKRISALYIKDASRTNKLDFSFTIYKRILLEEINRNRSVYVRETDLVISKDKVGVTLPHPNSSEGLQQFDIERNKDYQGQAGVFVRVVDNENLAKVRYYYSGMHLITVPSTNDDQRESGVYCTISSTAPDGLILPVSKFFSFEDAESNIGLYRTQEEALSHGDPELALRAEEARSKNEERRLTRELIEVKHKSEMEANKAKHELETIKSENARLKESIDLNKTLRDNTFDVVKKDRDVEFDTLKRHREDYYDDRNVKRKDYYEERSSDRKDTSELIKFIPALLVGIAGTFIWMKSQQA